MDEVREGNDVERGSLGVLRPRLGQRDGEWEVGMVGGQSMGQLLSKDSGARAWKHATQSAAATP
jgi:hypothetical protein